MSIYEIVDGATAELMASFWEHVRVVTAQGAITEADALRHMKRSATDRIKAAKPNELVDYVPDGRAATWRVRLTIWRGSSDANRELFADTDSPKPYEAPGSELVQGLPAVANWTWALIQQAHPGATLQDIDAATVHRRLPTLRVALSNQRGEVVWRHRYIVAADETPTAPRDPDALKSLRDVASRTRGAAPFMAIVRISQESGTGRRKSA